MKCRTFNLLKEKKIKGTKQAKQETESTLEEVNPERLLGEQRAELRYQDESFYQSAADNGPFEALNPSRGVILRQILEDYSAP